MSSMFVMFIASSAVYGVAKQRAVTHKDHISELSCYKITRHGDSLMPGKIGEGVNLAES